MKRIAVLIVFVFLALASFSQEPEKVKKETTDPPKKEAIKTVPKTTQNQEQIKKAQQKKAQIQNKKTKQVIRKTRAIRKKRNG